MSKRKRHSKKHKKRKPSRRERRAGVDRPVKHPEPATERLEAAADATAAGRPEPTEGAGTRAETPRTADAATGASGATAPPEPPAAPFRPPEPSVSATFRPVSKSDDTVAIEQRYIGRDLRRLGVQLAAFVLVIIGLAVLDAQTDLVGGLGSELFKLWE